MILSAQISVLFTNPLPLSEISTEPLLEAIVSGLLPKQQMTSDVSGGGGLK